MSSQAGPSAPSSLVSEVGEAESVSRPHECPTCYVALDTVLVGVPAGCEHKFCVECLQGWILNSNTCPVDRHRFNTLRIYEGEELVNTLAVPTVQVQMAPPLRPRLQDWQDRPARRPAVSRRRQPDTGPSRSGTVGHLSGEGWDGRRRYPLRTETVRAVVTPTGEDRGATRPTPPTPTPGMTIETLDHIRRVARNALYIVLARRKYQQATVDRPPPITIPSGCSPLNYRLKDRIQWAREITASLPLPVHALEARYRIQSPTGSPFPFAIPRWANFWHIGVGRRNRRGCPRGGQKAKQYDLCKLLWLEGYPRSVLPVPPSPRALLH